MNPDPLGDALDDSIGERPDEEIAPEFPESDFEVAFVSTVPPEAEKPIVEKPERKSPPQAKAGAPSLDEWQDFIGRFVIRGITEGYLSLALSDFYEDLTPRELESIRLTKEDLKELSAPLATLANKNKFLKSKGRSIIGAADSGEAVIALVIWMRRVNRIAKKYRKTQAPKARPVQGFVVREEEFDNGTNGPNVGQGEGPEYPGFGGLYNPGTG